MIQRTDTLFISHASEDKSTLVRKLAHALKRRGLKVWYDEFSLKPGDSLRRSIDTGLQECAAGVVVLSPSFFAKEWPQRELDALYTGEVAGRLRIIPVWHEVDAKYVSGISPLLADRIAIHSSVGIEAVALAIADQFPDSTKNSGAELAELIENCQTFGEFAGEANLAGCRYRFLQLNAFKAEYQSIAHNATSGLSDQEIEDFAPRIERLLDQEHERLRMKYRIPKEAYLTSDEPVRKEHLQSYLDDIEYWASGTLTRDRSARLVFDLDRDELDEYYVLLGLPNFSFSRPQRHLLEPALVELGCAFAQPSSQLESLCVKLRALDSDA